VTELDRQDATFKIISEDTQPPAPTLIGDVNADGKIDSTDLTLLKRYLLRSATLTEEKILNADTDGNGTVNSTDLNYLKKYILRVISVFPAEAISPRLRLQQKHLWQLRHQHNHCLHPALKM